MGIPHTSPIDILESPVATDPSTPAAGVLSVFAKSIAGKTFLATKDDTGNVDVLQALLGTNSVTWLNAAVNSTTFDKSGTAAPTFTGTATSTQPSTSNFFNSIKRVLSRVTVAATTAVAGIHCPIAWLWRGNGANLGGFLFQMTWGPDTGVSTTTSRAFAGLHSSTGAPTDVEPSGIVGSYIGMGWDAADTNIQIMSNDNSGSATKTDLGASFPVPTADTTSVYRITLYCKPNDTKIEYRVKNLVTLAETTGSITTDLPAAATMMTPKVWMSVGGTSSVIGVAVMSMYAEAGG